MGSCSSAEKELAYHSVTMLLDAVSKLSAIIQDDDKKPDLATDQKHVDNYFSFLDGMGQLVTLFVEDKLKKQDKERVKQLVIDHKGLILEQFAPLKPPKLVRQVANGGL